LARNSGRSSPIRKLHALRFEQSLDGIFIAEGARTDAGAREVTEDGEAHSVKKKLESASAGGHEVVERQIEHAIVIRNRQSGTSSDRRGQWNGSCRGSEADERRLGVRGVERRLSLRRSEPVPH
jgi:hypothetical protein